MLLLRSILYFSYLTLSVISFTIVLITVGFFIDFRNRSKITNLWGKSNLSALKILCRLDYTIEGLENIPSENCIVMCKHQSAWETIALRGILPPEQAWILKKELMSVPFFGWGLRMVEPIAIDRKSGRRAAKQIIEQGISSLKAGRWVVIFPEGTRVDPGVRKKYGIGGGLLAEKSGYSILPITHNAGDYWRRRSLIKRPGKIQLRIGRPINVDNMTAAQITRNVENWIESNIPTSTVNA